MRAGYPPPCTWVGEASAPLQCERKVGAGGHYPRPLLVRLDVFAFRKRSSNNRRMSAIDRKRHCPPSIIRSGFRLGRGRVLHEKRICSSGYLGRSRSGASDRGGRHSTRSMENHDRGGEQRNEDAASDERALLDRGTSEESCRHVFSTARRHEQEL